MLYVYSSDPGHESAMNSHRTVSTLDSAFEWTTVQRRDVRPQSETFLVNYPDNGFAKSYVEALVSSKNVQFGKKTLFAEHL